MSRGKRYEQEPKLNLKKVFAVVIAIAVVIMFVFIIKGILLKGEEKGKITSKSYYTIFKDNKKDINLMLFDEIYAYRKEDKVAILVPNMPIKTYLYKDKKLIEIEEDSLLEKEALSLIYVLDDMYKNKSYK